MPFVPATKHQSRLRLLLAGPTGSGKTYSALAIATALAGPDAKPAVIDTERGTASKYSHLFAFDKLELSTFHPRLYVEAIQEAEQAGYSVLVIDSLSHAWVGEGGTLDQVGALQSKPGANQYTVWREPSKEDRKLVDTILQSRMHVVATVRSKQDYAIDNGKVRKVGMAPIQRDGIEYEFDVCGDLNTDHTLTVSKTRCSELDGAVIPKPGAELAAQLLAWVSEGAPEPEVPAVVAYLEGLYGLAHDLATLEEANAEVKKAWPGLTTKHKALIRAAVHQASQRLQAPPEAAG